jgi:parallel beta-helix repeat protein
MSHVLRKWKGRLAFSLSVMVALTLILTALPEKVGATATLPLLPVQMNVTNVSVTAGASTSTIQTAIDTASTGGGGTVTFAAGTYNITAPITLKSNVTLVGAGSSSTVLKRNSTTDLGGNGVLNVANGGLINAIIKNLTVDGNTATDPNTNPTTLKTYGILVQGADGSNDKILLDNIIVQNSEMGVHFKGTTNLTIQNSTFTNNGGLYYFWHNLYLRRVSKVLVKNSVLSHSSSANGINISYSDNITIDTCQVYNNYFRGIRAADSSYIDVINNNVYSNSTGDGIIYNSETTGVTNFRINGNTVSNNGGYGISVSSNSSNGEVKLNVDGGGNVSGFKKISGSNIIVQ